MFVRKNPMVALFNVPLFHDLNHGELREIEEVLQRRVCGPGEVIFEQGHPGEGMYVVMSGSVDILREDEDGTRLRLGHMETGAFFGELALLDDAPRTASAVATEETELAVFSRWGLLAVAEEHPRLGAKIVMHLSQIVAERLRRTNRALKEVRDEHEAAQRCAATGSGTQ